MLKSRFNRKPNSSCKIYGKPHPTHNCWHNKNKRVPAGAEIASSAGFHSSNKRKNLQSRGLNWNQGRINYRQSQSSNEKVDHKVNFCKVKNEQPGLENCTRPLVFMSGSSVRASGNCHLLARQDELIFLVL